MLIIFHAAVTMAHMSLVLPPSRNAVDRSLPSWAGGKWWPYDPHCANPSPHWDPQIPSGCIPPETDGWGCNCANGTEPCDVGQSCFWFSDGCSIGCKTCDGLGGNPNTRDRCKSGQKATLCDPRLRTYNMDAPCNTDADIYRYNPWRFPGNAPVLDSCGMAGGGPKNMPGQAKYTTTVFAKTGDLGSSLPPLPTGIVWRAGTVVTAKWSIRANHGGGCACSPMLIPPIQWHPNQWHPIQPLPSRPIPTPSPPHPIPSQVPIQALPC